MPTQQGMPSGLASTLHLTPECIFSGPLPIIFRSVAGPSDVQAKRSDSVTIDLTLIPTSANKRVPLCASHVLQALEIKLTDINDPFFMWQCTVSEDDYHVMKREQGIMIDFQRFPYYLMGLFEKCSSHYREQQPA